jgi:hypothetical protein
MRTVDGGPRLAMAFSERYLCGSMSLHPAGFIEPRLPTGSQQVLPGPQWAYEIKRFRFICHRDGERVACSHAPITTGARSFLRSPPPCERCRRRGLNNARSGADPGRRERTYRSRSRRRAAAGRH